MWWDAGDVDRVLPSERTLSRGSWPPWQSTGSVASGCSIRYWREPFACGVSSILTRNPADFAIFGEFNVRAARLV